jgi:hypothetical protein
MHNERCTSGLARGYAKPPAARPAWRAYPTQPYIRLARGFAYLVAVIDWYSRKVLSWRISNSMDAGFCVDCLEDALSQYGKPEIFNSDQGSQFTSDAFIGVLKGAGVAISMDGRGRALDNIFVERLWRNVKHEDVYLKGYATMGELTMGLAQYFAYYNAERPHQSLGYQTPAEVYLSGCGGGARIVVERDNYSVRRVASRRNVTRRIVVVSLSFFSSFVFLRGAERPAPGDFQLFRNSHFGWRISGLSQAAQNQFFYALCSPRLDPAL